MVGHVVCILGSTWMHFVIVAGYSHRHKQFLSCQTFTLLFTYSSSSAIKKENLLVQMHVWRDSSDLHLLTRVNCQKRDGYIPNDLLRELRKNIS